jgi:phosphomannomutase
MLTRDVLIGGEESGGIAIKGPVPERDGILNSLLLAEVMADTGKTLGELVAELSRQFGPHHYARLDLEIERAAIDRVMRQLQQHKVKTIAGLKVTAMEDLDGIKLLFGDTAWLLVRPSGTENLLRLYAETPTLEQTKALLEKMAAIAKGQT